MIDIDSMSKEEQERLVVDMYTRLSPDGRAKLLEAMASRTRNSESARALREKAKQLQGD